MKTSGKHIALGLGALALAGAVLIPEKGPYSKEAASAKFNQLRDQWSPQIQEALAKLESFSKPGADQFSTIIQTVKDVAAKFSTKSSVEQAIVDGEGVTNNAPNL